MGTRHTRPWRKIYGEVRDLETGTTVAITQRAVAQHLEALQEENARLKALLQGLEHRIAQARARKAAASEAPLAAVMDDERPPEPQ